MQQPRRRGAVDAAPPLGSRIALLLLLALASASSAVSQLPVTFSVGPWNASSILSDRTASQSRAYAAAMATLQEVIDAYAAKLATQSSAIDTAILNHDAKAGIRLLATGAAADVAAAKARAQAVVGAALANAIGQRCPNGSFPIPFDKRLAVIEASNRSAKQALVGALRNKTGTISSRAPAVSIAAGNQQASQSAAKAAAGVAQQKAQLRNALNKTTLVPALRSLVNETGILVGARVASNRSFVGSQVMLTAAPRRRRRLLASAFEDSEAWSLGQGPDENSLFSSQDLENLDATTDDVDGLLKDAAEAYAESMLSVGGVRIDFPWAKTWNLTINAAKSARAAKNATRLAIRGAAARLPPPLNTTAAKLEALGSEAGAALLAAKGRADDAFDVVASEEAKEAVIKGVRTRVWAVVQALDPRADVDVNTGTGCLVPNGYYVRNTVAEGYMIDGCSEDNYCPGGLLVSKPGEIKCPMGTSTLGASESGSISNCYVPPGSYRDVLGQIQICAANNWCLGGPYDMLPMSTPCGAGMTTLGATGSTSASACKANPCNANIFKPSMRAVIQRVCSASVEVDGAVVSSINRGILILVGVAHGDGPADVDWVARKVLAAKLFPSADVPAAVGATSATETTTAREPTRWAASVSDIRGEILCVSQFTLLGSLRKGTKPDFKAAAPPAEAVALYDSFLERVREGFKEPEKVKDGVFGAMMKVSLVNDGPVTLTLDSREGKSG